VIRQGLDSLDLERSRSARKFKKAIDRCHEKSMLLVLSSPPASFLTLLRGSSSLYCTFFLVSFLIIPLLRGLITDYFGHPTALPKAERNNNDNERCSPQLPTTSSTVATLRS